MEDKDCDEERYDEDFEEEEQEGEEAAGFTVNASSLEYEDTLADGLSSDGADARVIDDYEGSPVTRGGYEPEVAPDVELREGELDTTYFVNFIENSRAQCIGALGESLFRCVVMWTHAYEFLLL
jgi:hypothetical protein